jgi:hypothetical protein
MTVAALAAVLFAVPNVGHLRPTLDAVDYQARLTDGLGGVVQRAGGRDALLACGDPYAGPFQVPAVAWQLRIHANRVQLDPRAPAVVFRARNATRGPVAPALAGVGGEADVRTLAASDGWRVAGRCR